MPWEFKRLTPAELYAIADARRTEKRKDEDFMDALNARLCETMVMIATHGNSTAPHQAYMLRPPAPVKQTDDQMINGVLAFATVIKEGQCRK
jgi:hypothetical protein